LCHGKKFRNNEPINKLFPKLPINVLEITPPKDERFHPHHQRIAGLVFFLATAVLMLRIFVTG
jgi:hypothetical protein